MCKQLCLARPGKLTAAAVLDTYGATNTSPVWTTNHTLHESSVFHQHLRGVRGLKKRLKGRNFFFISKTWFRVKKIPSWYSIQRCTCSNQDQLTRGGILDLQRLKYHRVTTGCACQLRVFIDTDSDSKTSWPGEAYHNAHRTTYPVTTPNTHDEQIKTLQLSKCDVQGKEIPEPPY